MVKRPGSYIYIIICAAIIALGLYYRLYPVTHNIETRDLNLSRLLVYSNLRKTIASQLNHSYPNTTPAQKKQLQDQAFQRLLTEEDKNIKESVNKIMKNIGGLYKFYLLGADSYYYYALTKNLLSHGSKRTS